MSDRLRAALTHAVNDELDAALQRIAHCLNQLTDEQIWWRPLADMNSIGNLVLHLSGNVRQLIVSGVGGAPDDRNRPAEFAARDPIPKAELLRRVTEAVNLAKAAFASASDDALCGKIPVTKYDFTGIQAVVRCVAHFRGHTQEIIHQTRTILGEKYQYAGPK
jgi:hypothetical protein